MSIEEKVAKTLSELGVTGADGVRGLFKDVAALAEGEWRGLVTTAPSQVADAPEFRALHDRWHSRKKGILSQIDKNWLKPASNDLKPAVGLEFNELRKRVAQMDRPAEVLESRRAKPAARPSTEPRDITLPGNRRPLGSIHPITRVQREIEEIFLTLGYWIESGPEIESTYYNFDALNIPENHPARDDWDTLYIDSRTVLRTHTSPVQIHAMRRYGAPLHIIIPGKCYRRDNPDATHTPMFHQIEGMAIDRDVTFADLKGTLDFFAKRFFGDKTRTSFHPSFFPFTEPSGEVAVSCPFCDGAGCRTCKESGWIEVMGCGMVHPEVLRHGGIDPDRYSGWAFGLGVERYAMMKYGIHDIQLFYQSDLRFLEQF